MELEPMSSPTSCLLFPPNNIVQPLYAFLLPNRRKISSTARRLATLRVDLTHLAFHPAVQDGFAQLPPIAELERGYLAFGDVAVQGVRADAQILRRLPHIHHFTRFTHEERYSSDRMHARTKCPLPALPAQLREIAECVPCLRYPIRKRLRSSV